MPYQKSSSRGRSRESSHQILDAIKIYLGKNVGFKKFMYEDLYKIDDSLDKKGLHRLKIKGVIAVVGQVRNKSGSSMTNVYDVSERVKRMGYDKTMATDYRNIMIQGRRP